jgi:hypothetical protein
MMLADGADPQHRRARVYVDNWLGSGGGLVSTDYILDEMLTLSRVRLGLAAARLWHEQVDGSARVSWEWIDAGRAQKALVWFFRYGDKDFSFTDTTSFVVMKERKLRLALTSDRHFAQAGFTVVP